MKTYTRRQALHLLGVSAAGLLSGCVCRPFYSIDDLPKGRAFGGLPVDYPKPSEGDHVIRALDSHVHIFNASDMQAAGYVSEAMANELGGVLGKLLSKLGKFVDFISCRFAPSAADEVEMLNELLKDIEKTKPSTALSSRAAIAEQIIEQRITAQQDEIVDTMISELPETFWEEYGTLPGSLSSKSVGRSTRQLRKAHIEAALEAFESPDTMRSFGDRGTALKSEQSGIFAFLRNLMSFRFFNLKRYMKGYHRDDAAVKVEGCFVSLVDFDYLFGSKANPYTLLDDQVKLMEYIVKLSEGFVIPIVAYNPMVDVKHADKSLDRVKNAVMERGFVGVKIYPTLGYRPQNVEVTSESDVDLKLIQTKLDELYSWCIKEQVPVMAHSNYSMGTSDTDKEGAGPAAWRQLLERKEFENLQVHLGHFGHGSVVDGGKDWTTGFSDMILTMSGNQIYGDLAFWDELWQKPKLQNLLKKNLLRTGSGGADVIDRVMYGSDWHMLSRIKNWPYYPSSLHQFLVSMKLKSEHINRFFHLNALRLYRLDSGKNLGRLIPYYKQLGIKPGWLELVPK